MVDTEREEEILQPPGSGVINANIRLSYIARLLSRLRWPEPVVPKLVPGAEIADDERTDSDVPAIESS